MSPRGTTLFWDTFSVSAGAGFGPNATPGKYYGPTPEPAAGGAPAQLTFTVVPNHPDAIPQLFAYSTGQQMLLDLSWEDLEDSVIDLIDRTVNKEGGDFDPARDIHDWRINRWVYGYAHELTSTFDPSAVRAGRGAAAVRRAPAVQERERSRTPTPRCSPTRTARSTRATGRCRTCPTSRSAPSCTSAPGSLGGGHRAPGRRLRPGRAVFDAARRSPPGGDRALPVARRVRPRSPSRASAGCRSRSAAAGRRPARSTAGSCSTSRRSTRSRSTRPRGPRRRRRDVGGARRRDAGHGLAVTGARCPGWASPGRRAAAAAGSSAPSGRRGQPPGPGRAAAAASPRPRRAAPTCSGRCGAAGARVVTELELALLRSGRALSGFLAFPRERAAMSRAPTATTCRRAAGGRRRPRAGAGAGGACADRVLVRRGRRGRRAGCRAAARAGAVPGRGRPTSTARSRR